MVLPPPFTERHCVSRLFGIDYAGEGFA